MRHCRKPQNIHVGLVFCGRTRLEAGANSAGTRQFRTLLDSLTVSPTATREAPAKPSAAGSNILATESSMLHRGNIPQAIAWPDHSTSPLAGCSQLAESHEANVATGDAGRARAAVCAVRSILRARSAEPRPALRESRSLCRLRW